MPKANLRRKTFLVSVLFYCSFFAVLHIFIRLDTSKFCPSSSQEASTTQIQESIVAELINAVQDTFYRKEIRKSIVQAYKILNIIQNEWNATRLSESSPYARLLAKNALLDWFIGNNTIINVLNSYNGQGIVIPIGNKQLKLGLHLILSIRKIWKSTLPIHVCYIGNDDLTEKNINILKDIEFVFPFNLYSVIDQEKIKFDGWNAKPACLLAAKCSECILIDSDVLLFQPPETLFKQNGYIETGTLYFYDRINGYGLPGFNLMIEMLKKLIPPERFIILEAKTKFLQKTSNHNVESGVVAFNKAKNFAGLLSITFMNNIETAQIALQGQHGDKESFWIGLELLDIKYHIDKHYWAAVNGEWDNRGEFCAGTPSHVDQDEKLLWMNGGIYDREREKDGKGFVFREFHSWILSSESDFGSYLCVGTSEKKPQKLNDDLLLKLDFMKGALWLECERLLGAN